MLFPSLSTFLTLPLLPLQLHFLHDPVPRIQLRIAVSRLRFFLPSPLLDPLARGAENMHICTISAFNLASQSCHTYICLYYPSFVPFLSILLFCLNMGIITDFNLAGVEHSITQSSIVRSKSRNRSFTPTSSSAWKKRRVLPRKCLFFS